MDITDLVWETGEGGARLVKVFSSIDGLKKEQKCVKNCGIVKVEIRIIDVIEEPSDKNDFEDLG